MFDGYRLKNVKVVFTGISGHDKVVIVTENGFFGVDFDGDISNGDFAKAQRIAKKTKRFIRKLQRGAK